MDRARPVAVNDYRFLRTIGKVLGQSMSLCRRAGLNWLLLGGRGLSRR